MTIQSNSHIHSSFKSISRVSGIIVIFIGSVVLLGWVFDIAILKSLIPALPNMMPNTAFCFMLSGISLLLLQNNRNLKTSKSKRLLAQACAIAILLIGTLTLIEYIFKINLGIDELLFRDTETPAASYPGRMSPQTSVNFLLLGISLLLMDFKIKRFYPSHLSTLFIVFLSLLSLFGQVYSIPAFYSISYYTGMALPTAIGFIIISAGIFFARPEYGVMSVISSDTAGGFIARRLLPVSIILPFVLGFLILEGQRAGLYGTEAGITILVTLSILIFTTLILWYAERLNITDTERMKTDESLRNANRTLKMIGECNMALVRAANEEKLLKTICNIIVNSGGYRMAWVGFTEFDKKKSIRLAALAGHNGDYIEKENITLADTEMGRGPVATAIRSSSTIICKNILTDPDCAPWRDNAIRHGYASSITFPLAVASDKHPLGVLNIYDEKPDAFDGEEIKLLMSLADDLSFGINTIRAKIEHERVNRENQLLKTIALSISESEDMHSAIQIVLNKVCEATGWVYGESWIPNKDRNLLEYGVVCVSDVCHTKFFEHSKKFTFKPGIGLPGRVWSSKKPEWIRDVSVNGHVFLRTTAAMEAGLKAALGIPIIADNEVLAVIIFYMSKASIEDENQFNLITSAASQLGSIIQRKKAEEDKAKLETQIRHMQRIEEIGQLTGGIAHDFNNLLTTITLSGHLLKKKIEDNSEGMYFLQQILSTVDRAANLTKSLLTFSRKQVLDKKAVSLNNIINNIEKLLSRLIGEDIDFKVNLSGEDIILMADAGQIEQVIMNLSTNARDAMPDGGVLTIDTSLMNIEDEFTKEHLLGKAGTYALIAVTDTGAGMDEATKEKIFDPFFTTKEAGKGTGLGLSIVHGIIKQHDGYINVYSEVGKGTTFKIYLPIVKSEIEGAKEKELITPKGGTEIILLAEDEAKIREFAISMLEGYGYRVIEAVDGEDAIKKFEQNKDKFSLLITDVIMPKRNGKDVYNEIKKTKPDIKAIFTSGYNEEVIHKKGILEEGLNFISKPFAPTEFLRKVREVLDNQP